MIGAYRNMTWKQSARRFLRKLGFDAIRFEPHSHPLARLKQLLVHHKINVVLDVGANRGQFAEQLRRDLDFDGRIISFEPLHDAFAVLQTKARPDTSWTTLNFALGNTETTGLIHVAGNSLSSSLLPILATHTIAAPESVFIADEPIQIRRLDSVFEKMCASTDRVYLKIDTQGYEKRVLEGAEESLTRIDIVQLEMSLIPLYDGETLFTELCALLDAKGYRLVGLEPVFTDKQTGHLLQVDGIFHRSSPA